MKNIEKATQTADMPHQFLGETSGSDNGLCDVCWTGHRDPRHLAWEIAHRHEIERAQAEAAGQSLPRETGA